MTQPVLIKAYGSFTPAKEAFCAEMSALCGLSIGESGEDGVPVARVADGYLLISFEGIWFPVDEIRLLLGRQTGLSGKLDVLDLENWRLERMEFRDGVFRQSTAPLNNVLDYSGF